MVQPLTGAARNRFAQILMGQGPGVAAVSVPGAVAQTPASMSMAPGMTAAGAAAANGQSPLQLANQQAFLSKQLVDAQDAEPEDIGSGIGGLANTALAGYLLNRASGKEDANRSAAAQRANAFIAAQLQAGASPDVSGGLAAMTDQWSDPTQAKLIGDILQNKMNPDKDPLVQVYDPITKSMKFIPTSLANGMQSAAPAEAKAPTTRDILRDGVRVYQQFDPASNSWTDVGSGPAFAPPAQTTIELPKSINSGDSKAMELGAADVAQAQSILPLFGVAREAAKNFDQSGPLGKGALLYERGKSMLGLPNDAAAGEVLQGMQTRLGTLLRVPGSGATSDMEMSMYMQGVPSLLNTKQGNIALANIGEKLVRARIQNYKKMQQYIIEHGSSVGYQADETPVLSTEDMAILQGGGQTAPATTITPRGGQGMAEPSTPKEGSVVIQGGNKFKIVNGQPVYQGPK